MGWILLLESKGGCSCIPKYGVQPVMVEEEVVSSVSVFENELTPVKKEFIPYVQRWNKINNSKKHDAQQEGFRNCIRDQEERLEEIE